MAQPPQAGPNSPAGCREIACSIRTADLDEIEKFFRREFATDHARTPAGRGPWSFDFNLIHSGRSGIDWGRSEGAATVRACVPFPCVHLLTDQRSAYRVGRRRLQADPDTAVVLFPDHEYTRQQRPATHVGLSIDGRLLAREIEARRAARAGTWVPRSIELPAAAIRPDRLRLDVARILAAPAGPARDERFRRWEAGAAAQLARALLEHEGTLAATPAGVQLAEDVERWIVAHLAEALSTDVLSAVFGVSGSWLQRCVRARWGMSPQELIVARRLGRVRGRLVALALGQTVSQVALESGFSHLGRFAAAYRDAYGERPSDTAARARASRRRA